MEQKRLGIIGGMGSKATAVFMDMLVEHTEAKRDQDHLDMVILNHASLPDRTEVIRSNEGERFLNEVEKDIRLLEYAQVANIAIPCNTSHFFHAQMQAMTNIPIIHIVEETFKEICTRLEPGSRVGVLATNGTMQSGIYRDACVKYGMEYYSLSDDLQQRVMDIIYLDVKRDNNVSPQKLEALINELVDLAHCQCIIIACTELSCISIGDKTRPFCVDAMDVLVKRSIELSGKRSVGWD